MRKSYLLFLSVMIISCDESSETDTSVIMPLQVGNYWRFIDSSFNTGGTLSYTDTTVLSITGTKSFVYQDTTYEVYLWTWDNPGLKGFSWLTWYGNDGLYMFGGTSPKRDYILTKNLHLKYPVQSNDQWNQLVISAYTSDSSFRITDTTLMSCTSTHNDLQTQAGTFKCYVYEYSRDFSEVNGYTFFSDHFTEWNKSQASTSNTVLYYSPNIGYIGSNVYTDGHLTFKKRLLSYHLE